MAEESKAPRVWTEKVGEFLVVRLKTKVLEDRDLNQVTDFIAPASPAAGVKAVVLDLSHVQFMPSLALGVLMKWNDACKRREQELRVAAITPQVRDVMRITRLDRVLHLHDTVDDAAK
ncbi:MAG TPA: STAS domain-containing protein [Tepidisphaeraceae bacterium]|jgi:anti-sigma B factor antagonist|nr:STAS domain-containing protein [Tepidisphaeraceae bacterium]